MTTPATGLFTQVGLKAETTFGTAAGDTGAQLLRRTQFTLAPSAAFFKSAEINPDRQLRDARKGTKSIAGNLTGELSPGTYKALMAAMLGASSFTSGSTTGALTNVTAAAGSPPGTFTRAAGSYLTDGFKVGDIVQWTGWATTGTANNSRNYRITSLTATVMTVGTAATGASGQPEAVAAKASGDSVTCTVVGKKLITPASSLSDASFSIEGWHSDVSLSELFLGCKPTQMALKLPATGIATVDFSIMGQDITTAGSQYFTSPTAVSTSNLAAAVNGKLSVGGTDYATVTGLDITVAGGHQPVPVVGSQLSPGIFPGLLEITGQVTALFEAGTLRDLFLNETESSMLAVLTLTSAINSDFIAFSIPRLKFTGNSKSDSPGALVQTLPFRALLQTAGGSGTTADATSLTIQDSLA